MFDCNITVTTGSCDVQQAYDFISSRMDTGYVLFESTEFVKLTSLEALCGYQEKEDEWLSCFRCRAFAGDVEVLMEKEPFATQFEVRCFVEEEGSNVLAKDTSYLLRPTRAIGISKYAKGHARLTYRRYYAADDDGMLVLKADRLVGLQGGAE